MIGSTIGSYRINSALGEGGMGVVYHATEVLLDREVALKALHPQITRDESRLERFKAEAKALARLHHPNIATLFNFFEHEGVYYMVMEFIEGQTLEDVVRQNGALPLRPALEIFSSGLKGFAHAHERGVIHRDIKPSNLMLTREGDVKITDFGIARVAGGGKLTQTGKLIGTLEYMSPEQVQGHEQDARSDIYSLGILLFELVTGKMPWSTTSDFDIMRAHLELPAPPARSLIAELPPELDAIITRALAKKPDERFQSVREMSAALEGVVADLPATQAAVFPLVSPTRVVDAPFSAPPETRLPPGKAPIPATNEAAAPPKTPTAITGQKWLWPAVGIGGATLLLLGFLAMSARRGNVVPETVPTSVPAIVQNVDPTPTEAAPIETVENTPEPEESTGGFTRPDASDPGLVPENPDRGDSGSPKIEIPQNLPGLTAPTAAPPQPTAKPVPKPTAKPRSKPRVVTRPKPRPKPRVVARPRPKPRPKPRVVARPKPRPKPKPRPVARPRPKSPSKEDRLRALVKGD